VRSLKKIFLCWGRSRIELRLYGSASDKKMMLLPAAPSLQHTVALIDIQNEIIVVN
jgi:hypothetical protein